MTDLSPEQLNGLIRRLAHEGPHTYALPFLFPAVDAGLADFFGKPDEIATIGVEVSRTTLTSGSARYSFRFPQRGEIGAIRVRLIDERATTISVMFSPRAAAIPLEDQEFLTGIVVLALKRFIAWFYRDYRELVAAAEHIRKNQPPPEPLPTFTATVSAMPRASGRKSGILTDDQKETVRKYRAARARGETQKQFCTREGVGESTLRRWEKTMEQNHEL